MAHLHSVYDTDMHFSIDPVTRTIKNESGKITLIQNDHNSERFTFECPRYIDGHDMSLCNKVEIHYINLGSNTKGVYECDDFQISPESDDVVICSWLLSHNVTSKAGSLNFVLHFVCLTNDVIDYSWSTAIHSSISISNGINNSETIVEENVDVLEQWSPNQAAGHCPL